MKQRFLEAAELAERAASLAGTEAELAATMQALQYMEEIEIAMLNERLRQLAPMPRAQAECLPLRCEGDDIGRVEARIPKNLYFRFLKQKNFGEEGFTSDEGMRDFLKAFPQYAVKTVSGKTTVGYRGTRNAERGTGRVKFGPGVLNLAT